MSIVAFGIFVWQPVVVSSVWCDEASSQDRHCASFAVLVVVGRIAEICH